jgi:sulfur carrier protein ThiS
MNITVKLWGVLRQNRFIEEVRQYSDGITVQEVLEDLECQSPLLGAILINGTHASIDQTLQEGDTLTLLTLLDGG